METSSSRRSQSNTQKCQQDICPKVNFQETIEPNQESITSREKILDSLEVINLLLGSIVSCNLDLQNKVHRNHTFILCNPMLKVGITLHKFIKTKKILSLSYQILYLKMTNLYVNFYFQKTTILH